jgi:hypothetical protein
MIRAAIVLEEHPQDRISGAPLKLSLRRTEVYSVRDNKTRGGKKWVFLVFLEPHEQTSLNGFYHRLAARPPIMTRAEPETEAEEDELLEGDLIEIPPLEGTVP